jgi:hypothetical protein
MSYSYLIGPIEFPAKLEIDIDYFIQQLKTKWPDATVRQTMDQSTIYSLEWQLKTGGEGALYGGLRLSPPIVSIDGGDLSLIAEFAIWYRSIIPSEFKLYFYVSSLNREPMELKEDTKEAEIRENFG